MEEILRQLQWWLLQLDIPARGARVIIELWRQGGSHQSPWRLT